MHERLKAIDDAKELSRFHSQPKQMRAGAPGKIGELKLAFSLKNNRHVLSHLYRVTPLLVQQALYWDEAMPELPICSIISVGGGVLQGDRYHIDIRVNKDACAHVTSQGANRIHRMDANYASQYQSITLEEGAYLEFMPDFTILYKQSRYITETDIVVGKGASLLYGEMVMLGRLHHEDERMEFDLLSLLTRVVTVDGKKLFTEKILLEPDGNDPELVSQMQRFNVFANILCLTSVENATLIMAEYEAYFAEDNSMFAAVSKLPNDAGLMLRVVAQESHQVSRQVKTFWGIFRRVVKDKALPEACLWR
ncbi:urease accessory protein UreD [Shewanella sp. 0m-8]